MYKYINIDRCFYEQRVTFFLLFLKTEKTKKSDKRKKYKRYEISDE